MADCLHQASGALVDVSCLRRVEFHSQDVVCVKNYSYLTVHVQITAKLTNLPTAQILVSSYTLLLLVVVLGFLLVPQMKGCCNHSLILFSPLSPWAASARVSCKLPC